MEKHWHDQPDLWVLVCVGRCCSLSVLCLLTLTTAWIYPCFWVSVQIISPSNYKCNLHSLAMCALVQTSLFVATTAGLATVVLKVLRFEQELTRMDGKWTYQRDRAGGEAPGGKPGQMIGCDSPWRQSNSNKKNCIFILFLKKPTWGSTHSPGPSIWLTGQQ